jgi:FKBP-type peptidyl-prolyl cis-trans isomerase 2
MVISKSPDGRGIPQLSVHEAKDKTFVVDLNHPLAGKPLNFDVKVKSIKFRRGKITSGPLYLVETNKPGLGVPAGPQ